MDRKELIESIVATEWQFLQETHNKGGRAGCQDSPGTFRIMRASQFACWPDSALASYRADLDAALAKGRNPVTEKYAYMMRRTWPEEFAGLEPHLPPVSAEKMALIRRIVDINVDWEEECDRRFPHVRAQGRPLRSSSDTRASTSFETYLEGELCTYGMHTLELLLAHMNAARERGENLAAGNLDNMVRAYGYESAEALEALKAGGKA